jgi:hypothetical protein
MRLIFTIVVGILAVVVTNTILGNLPYHNSILYGIFAIFLSFKLYRNLHTNNLIKKGVSQIGEIIAIEKTDKNEMAEINYVADVKFTSPYDNKEYQIKTHLNSKPVKTAIHLIINKENPLKSKVLEKSSSTENSFLIIAFIAFCYLAIINI